MAVKEFFAGLFGSAVGIMWLLVIILYSIGSIYWLWIAIKIGSFMMFVCGFIPPFCIFTGFIGGYSILFGVPDWVFNTFG